MVKTKITFYSGLDTIGGVIMEVKYGNDRAFFEAGTAYNPSFDMFDGSVSKRNCFVKDYLWINDLPPIDGIYSEEDVKGTNLKSAEECSYHQAFFITHLHLDHMRLMNMIDKSVTVYLSKPAQRLEKALEDLGQGAEGNRGFIYEDIKEDTTFGNIHVHRFMLNDDSYQDYSFLIETPDLKIHHTGDIFVYGKYKNSIEKEIAYLNKKNIDLLSVEGTRFAYDMSPLEKVEADPMPDDLLTKDELDERIMHKIASFKGLVFFHYYEREMSDVMDLKKYAEKTSRILVFEPDSAHLINAFFNESCNVKIPDDGKTQDVSGNKIISKQEILKDPEHYLVQFTYEHALELLDYRDIKTLFMHLDGVPIGSFDSRFNNLMNIVKLANCEYFEAYQYEDKYFTTHASKEQILAYIDAVNLRLCVPCHTSNRKAMIANITKPAFYAIQGVTYAYNREKNTLEECEYED